VAPGIRLLLVDGLNLIRRVYAAQPGVDGPERAREGRDSSARSLQRAQREVAPTHAVVVLEGPEPTWRHRLHPGYKEGHAPMPEALGAALPEFREAFAELGVPSFELPGTEADDRIFLQLLSDRVKVRDHFGKRFVDGDEVVRRFGVDAERLLDLLALTGDSSNSIPGVPGVGPKTAAKLLAAWGSLEAVLALAHEPAASDGPPRLTPTLARKLIAHADDARLARSLLALRTDLELGLNLRDLRRAP